MKGVKGENTTLYVKSHNKPFAPPHTEPHKKVHETRGFYYKLNYICNTDMEERKLNEKESLELIAQMISSARQNASKQPRHSKERYLAPSAESHRKA